MKILFDIGQHTDTPGNHLLTEIGPTYAAAAIWNGQQNAIELLVAATFEETEMADALPKFFNRFANHSPASVTAAIAFPQAVVVPQKFSAGGERMVDALFGNADVFYAEDKIPEWQLGIAYAVPNAVDQFLKQQFSSLVYKHVYTPMLLVNNGIDADEQLQFHIATGYFRVLVKKSGQVLLAQTYRYQTPLDVVYYLLKICEELGLSQTELHIIISGMIEKSSALHGEIEDYFANVHFAVSPSLNLPQMNVPQHYFTSLYNLAQCAL